MRTLVASLLNLDKFHLGSRFSVGTRAVTWAWLAIYVLVPLLMLIVLAIQARTPGSDPKLRQKVSGCLCTLTGARQFCAIRSYLSTAAKHGLSFFDALVMLTEGQPWIPAAA